MEYAWGTSFHDGFVEEFLRIKTPHWRCGGVIEEQAFLMEVMDNYFKKWRNTDLDSKPSTFIKGALENEEKQPINQSNQPMNQSIDSMSIRKS